MNFAETRRLIVDLVTGLNEAGIRADAQVMAVGRRPRRIRILMLSDDFGGVPIERRQQIVWRTAVRHPEALAGVTAIDTMTTDEHLGEVSQPTSTLN